MRSEAERAFHSAIMFHEGSIRCGTFAKDSDGSDRSYTVAEPQVVCMAFAAELYLKTLMLRRGLSAGRHNLNNLFNELTPEERQSLVARYIAARNCTEERMFRELAEVSHAFVQWRYSHEHKSAKGLLLDFGQLKTLAHSTYALIREIEPSWNVEPYFHDRVTAPDRLEYFFCVVGEDPNAMNRAVNRWLVSTKTIRSDPQPDIVKGEQDRFSFAPPILNVQEQAATLKAKISRAAGGAG